MRHLTLIALLAGGPALAEGARVSFDCAPVTSCNSAGICARVQGPPVTFDLAPTGFADGVQRYALQYGSVETEAVQRGDPSIAPVQWAQDGDLHFLVPGPDGFVWLRQWQSSQGADSEIRFLSCTVQ